MDDLGVEVQGDSIIVTMPGTDFSVTYETHGDTRHLVLTHSWISETVTTPDVFQISALAPLRPLSPKRESWAGSSEARGALA
jgi:hypothetical protein